MLVVVATAIAALIGIPAGIFIARRPRWRGPTLAFANVTQTIPSLALLGFLHAAGFAPSQRLSFVRARETSA